MKRSLIRPSIVCVVITIALCFLNPVLEAASLNNDRHNTMIEIENHQETLRQQLPRWIFNFRTDVDKCQNQKLTSFGYSPFVNYCVYQITYIYGASGSISKDLQNLHQSLTNEGLKPKFWALIEPSMLLSEHSASPVIYSKGENKDLVPTSINDLNQTEVLIYFADAHATTGDMRVLNWNIDFNEAGSGGTYYFKLQKTYRNFQEMYNSVFSKSDQMIVIAINKTYFRKDGKHKYEWLSPETLLIEKFNSTRVPANLENVQKENDDFWEGYIDERDDSKKNVDGLYQKSPFAH